MSKRRNAILLCEFFGALIFLVTCALKYPYVKTLRKPWQQSVKGLLEKLEKVNINKIATCIENDCIGQRGIKGQASTALPFLGHAQYFPSRVHVFSTYLADMQYFKGL